MSFSGVSNNIFINILQVFQSFNQVKAIAIGGSSSANTSDNKSDIDGYSCEYVILRAFEHTIYKDYQGKQYSILDDFEVGRWNLHRKGDSYEWYLDIETK